MYIVLTFLFMFVVQLLINYFTRWKPKYVGTMSLSPTESGGKMFTLEVNGNINLDDLENMSEVAFKVAKIEE